VKESVENTNCHGLEPTNIIAKLREISRGNRYPHSKRGTTDNCVRQKYVVIGLAGPGTKNQSTAEKPAAVYPQLKEV
jgi:hypothetical protein